jgi:hypothetical protein
MPPDYFVVCIIFLEFAIPQIISVLRNPLISKEPTKNIKGAQTSMDVDAKYSCLP